MLCLIYPDSVWGLSNYKKSVRADALLNFFILPCRIQKFSKKLIAPSRHFSFTFKA